MTDALTITLPVITISEPRRLRNGRYEVVAVCSDVPGLRHPFVEVTPQDADARARAFMHGQRRKFYKSLAAKHARAEQRILKALEDRQRPAMAETAA